MQQCASWTWISLFVLVAHIYGRITSSFYLIFLHSNLNVQIWSQLRPDELHSSSGRYTNTLESIFKTLVRKNLIPWRKFVLKFDSNSCCCGYPVTSNVKIINFVQFCFHYQNINWPLLCPINILTPTESTSSIHMRTWLQHFFLHLLKVSFWNFRENLSK